MTQVLLCNGTNLLMIKSDQSLVRYNTITHEEKTIAAKLKRGDKPPKYIVDRINQIAYYIKNEVLYIISHKNIGRIMLPIEINSIRVGKYGVYVNGLKNIYLLKDNKWNLVFETKEYEINAIESNPEIDEVYIALDKGWILCGVHTGMYDHKITATPVIYSKDTFIIKIDPVTRDILLCTSSRGKIVISVRYSRGEKDLYISNKTWRSSAKIDYSNKGDQGVFNKFGDYYSARESMIDCDSDFERHGYPIIGSATVHSIIINDYLYRVDRNDEIVIRNGNVIYRGSDIIDLCYGGSELYVISETLPTLEQPKTQPKTVTRSVSRQLEKAKHHKKSTVEQKIDKEPHKELYRVEKLSKCRYCGVYMKYRCYNHMREYNKLTLAIMCIIVYKTETITSGFGIESIVSRVVSKYL